MGNKLRFINNSDEHLFLCGPEIATKRTAALDNNLWVTGYTENSAPYQRDADIYTATPFQTAEDTTGTRERASRDSSPVGYSLLDS